MRSLFDTEDSIKERDFRQPMSDKLLKEWANHHSLAVTTQETAVGDALTVGGVLSVIVNPTADSSQSLRDVQAEFRATRRQLYYIYPWEEDTSHKLLPHFQSKLGLDSRKYAAKRLLIEEIDNSLANRFMRDYHIQGSAGGVGKVSIALKDKKTLEILAVQQFSRYRFGIAKGAGSVKDSPVWEGLRLCFRPGVQIYGGASRLQSWFEKKYSPEKILSYINLSHSSGLYKAAQGFTEITDWNQLSYMWALEGEPRVVPIIDKDGKLRKNDLDTARKKPYINPTTMAGAFGSGVGQMHYSGKLGSRKQLRAHPENGELVHNDVILEAIGYKKYFTAGQAKWEKVFAAAED